MHWIHLAQTLALTGATVHTMTPGAEPGIATVLIEEGRITAVGADVPIPEGAEELDLTGLHLIPGLIDGFGNHDPDHDALYLAAGVTLLRDTGNDPLAIQRVRGLEARDEAQGPMLFLPGAPIDGRPPATLESLVIDTPEQVAEFLPDYLETFAPDYLALGASLTPASWQAVIGFARENGLATWGPVPTGLNFAMALAGGQSGFTSFQGLLGPEQNWHELEGLGPIEASLQALEAKPTPIVPMLGVYQRMLVDRGSEPEELGLLAPHYRPNWVTEARTWQDQVQGEVRTITERTLALQQQIVARLFESGVPLLPGSGAPNSWLLPGRSLVEELRLWEEAGVAPYDVLRSATSGASTLLGVDADHGAIEVGRFADLVAIGLDPRESLAALAEPEVVVLRGRVHERPELEERVAELRAAQGRAWDEVLAPLDVKAPDLGSDVQLLLSGRTESRAVGLRVQAEHFAVGRKADGSMVFAARVITPASAGGLESETHLLQVLRDRRLESFDMAITSGEKTVTIQGRKLGGLMNVEARLDGNFLYNERAREALNMVDMGTGLSAVLVGYALEPGFNYVLGFREVSPMVHRWQLKVAEDDHQHIIDGGIGYLWFGFRANGAPHFGLRQQGNSQTELVVLEVLTGGGPGLELPEERVYLGPTTLEAVSGSRR